MDYLLTVKNTGAQAITAGATLNLEVFQKKPEGGCFGAMFGGRTQMFSGVCKVGEDIEIDWRNGPGNRNAYLGFYEVGVKPDYNPDYDGGLTWLYVDALPEGSIRLNEMTSEVVWPLPPGTYVARLMKDDGYEILAESAPFDIREIRSAHC